MLNFKNIQKWDTGELWGTTKKANIHIKIKGKEDVLAGVRVVQLW